MSSARDSAPVRVIVVESFAEIGGAQVCLLNALDAIDRNRADVSVVVPERGALSAALEERGVKVHTLRFRGVKSANPLRSAMRLLGNTKALARLVALTRSESADLLHAWMYRTYEWVSAAAWLSGRPAVGSLFDALSPQNMNRARKIATVRLANIFLTEILATSMAVRESAIQAGMNPDKVRVHYAGIDADRFQREARDSDTLRREWAAEDLFLVGSLGQFHEHKGHDLLLEAVARLAPRYLELRTAIIGGVVFSFAEHRDYEKRLRALPAQLGVQDRVIFSGWRNDRARAMAALDAVVVPSRFPDPQPNVVLEAMALGKPVIGAAIGGIPEMIEDEVTGILVPPNDSEALARVVERLFRHPELRAKLGAAAARRVRERFSLAKCADELASVYEKVGRAHHSLRRG